MFLVEFKKLFKPLLFLVALLVTFVYYNQNLNFIHEYWPNGAMISFYDKAEEWQNRFGQRVSDADIAEIDLEYANLLKQADQIIAKNTTANELNLEDYQAFQLWYQKNIPQMALSEQNEKERKIVDQSHQIQKDLIDDTGQDLMGKIHVLQTLIRSIKGFESSERFFDHVDYTKSEKERLLETVFSNEEWRNILPSYLTSTVAAHFKGIVILLIFLLSLLIPSIFVKDRYLKLQQLQWSSRHGRKIVWSQFWSGMIASFLLITCIVGIFGSLLMLTDFKQYLGNGLNSFFVDADEPLLFTYYSWTFAQWIQKIVLLVYLIGMAYSGALLFLSQTSQHYLSLLMKVIPVAFIYITITELILSDPFFLKNHLYQWTQIPRVELFTATLLLIISVSFPTIFCLRQKKKDLWN